MKMERALALALIALALSASVIYVLSLPEPELNATNLAMSYWHRYIVEHYRPEQISPAEINEYPYEHFIKDVPWISYGKAYCASTCLQMIAYKYGVKEPIEYFNFIMGFTYGAYFAIVDGALFIPGSDPLAGLAKASKYLGLRYRMLVAADESLFLKAIRYLISKDIPLILPVNGSRLYDLRGFSPHFVLAVGYSGDEIYIYEPVMGKEGIRYGEKGFSVKAETLAKAVREMIRGMGYPVSWSYALVYYTLEGRVEKDYREALRECAALQVGTRHGGYSFLGAYAFKALAKFIEEGKVDPEVAIVGLSMAATSRRDNVNFLKSAFPSDPDVLEAAKMLEKAAGIYEEVVEMLKLGYTMEVRSKVAEKLREAAGYEEKAGHLMALSAK